METLHFATLSQIKNIITAVSHRFKKIDKRIDSLPEWAKQENKPTYTALEVGALPDTTQIPSKTSDLENDIGYTTREYVDEATNHHANWEENDETSLSYIDNKPFYIEDFSEVIIPETTILGSSINMPGPSGFFHLLGKRLDVSPLFSVGDTIQVNINGSSYQLDAISNGTLEACVILETEMVLISSNMYGTYLYVYKNNVPESITIELAIHKKAIYPVYILKANSSPTSEMDVATKQYVDTTVGNIESLLANI